jgi:hypothetical protein
MMTESWAIELESGEKDLLSRIELNALALSGYDHAQANGKLVVELMQRVGLRNAIPKHRMEWFTNADYNIGGRGSSRLERFEANMGGDDIRMHPHFLAYLRYFIQGPDLPKAVMNAFTKAVEDCGLVTSGDVIPLAKTARRLTRQNRLNSSEAAEEFFKLALECGISVGRAIPIRNSVKSVR